MMKKLQLVLVGGLVVLAMACSSTSAVGPDSRVADSASSAVPTGGSSLLAVEAESTPAPRLILRTSGEPVYSSYAPQHDVFVIDFPRTTKSGQLAIPANLPDFVSSISADETVELGNALTRVTLRFNSRVDTVVMAEGDSVVVAFENLPLLSAEDAIPESVPIIAELDPVDEPAPMPEPLVIEDARTSAAPIPVKPVRMERSLPATRVEGIRTSGAGASLMVSIEADGSLDYTSFQLSNPLRLVVDLKGVTNGVGRSAVAVSDTNVERVRVGQFKSDPDPVARVVFDLNGMVDYEIHPGPRGLYVTFGEEASREVALATQPAPVPVAVAQSTPVWSEKETAVEVDRWETSASAVTVAPAPARHVVNSPQQATEPRNVEVRESDTLKSLETPQPEGKRGLGTILPGQSRTLSPGERVFTGPPISLDLTNSDIKDVLRLFSELTGLNVAIDPQVSGTVTVRFEDVPWDQALDLILRQNGLTYVLEGNVMRVGTLDRLTKEQEQTRQLEEQERLNVPLSTVIKYLSYAKANDVQVILSGMASPRGKIIVDQRTNQLIISEISTYLQTMLNLIDTIDIPTPQVIIEARIVETTKNFAQQLGISWGFNGTMDPALGTGTGLVFPNKVDVIGGPFEFGTGNPVLDVSLSNVLGTFDLDMLLTAAESEGLVKVVSAPRVTTQDNEAAEIQSGVQIPVQTRVNFTTTVTYIDATLRLSVTPQVTAEGTVIMEIQVNKTEPALGLAIVGGQNSPLTTRRAQTKLMVRDGGTTVIGGIYQATDNSAQTRVPFLHSIPIIGRLFKNKDISSRHDELLIFITPRIVKNT